MRHSIFRSTLGPGCVLLMFIALTLPASSSDAHAVSPKPALLTPPLMPFGYGVSVAAPDARRAAELGFNWIEVYTTPAQPQPTRVLYRVQLSASDWSNQAAFRRRLVRQIYASASFIDAFEIGNEVNLQSEWGAPPDAAQYVDLLCAAYSVIKSFWPNATVVSGGLATIGRVVGNYGGHLGHDGVNQDEREYLKEFLNDGGMTCTDVVGYHPLGFRASYSAAPDINGGTPETDCGNGLCFRSVEQIHAILKANGYVDSLIWATEVGWLVAPPDGCEVDPSWEGRAWQIVTPAAQASNLAGAFDHARANWPWLQAMFVFNLDFNQADYYGACEQMRYYSISGRPAETTLAGEFNLLQHRIHLPFIQRPANSSAILYHLSRGPLPWPNCGTMGIFGIVSKATGVRMSGVAVRIYVNGGPRIPGDDAFSTNRSDDRNYERTMFTAGDYQVVLYDPIGDVEISPRVNVTLVDRAHCDILSGERGSQWVQVDFRAN